jgi:recombinational DNA repair protein RecR
MHTAISANRAEIIKDKTTASQQRIQTSALQKRINEQDRKVGELIIATNGNIEVLHQAVKDNKAIGMQ